MSSDLSLQLCHTSSVLQLLGLQLHHEGKHLLPPALQQGLALPAELGLQGVCRLDLRWRKGQKCTQALFFFFLFSLSHPSHKSHSKKRASLKRRSQKVLAARQLFPPSGSRWRQGAYLPGQLLLLHGKNVHEALHTHLQQLRRGVQAIPVLPQVLQEEAQRRERLLCRPLSSSLMPPLVSTAFRGHPSPRI